MRVLLVGGGEALGRILARRLLACPPVEHVLAVEPLGGCAHAPHPRLGRLSVPLARPRSVRDLIFDTARDAGIDTVVNAVMHGGPLVPGGPATGPEHAAFTRLLLTSVEGLEGARRFVHLSAAAVYRVGPDQPSIVTTAHPLDFSAGASGRTRALVEADLAVCARMGLSRVDMIVLRLAPLGLPRALEERARAWSLRALGHDPMSERLSLTGAADAVCLALQEGGLGVRHAAGSDVRPRSHASARDLPVPGPLLPLLLRLQGWRRSFPAEPEDPQRAVWSAVLEPTRPDFAGPERRTPEDPAHAPARGAGSRAWERRATTNETHAPPRGRASAQARPPCASAMRRTSESPSPSEPALAPARRSPR